MKRQLIASIILVLFASSFIYSQDSSEGINRKNSVFIAMDFLFTFSVNYERIIPVKDNFGVAIKGGIGRDAGNRAFVAIGETALLFGRQKSYFEPGIAFQYPFYFSEEAGNSPKIALHAGYRYQAQSGFQFRVYPMFLIETNPGEDSWGNFPWLGLSVGYLF